MTSPRLNEARIGGSDQEFIFDGDFFEDIIVTGSDVLVELQGLTRDCQRVVKDGIRDRCRADYDISVEIPQLDCWSISEVAKGSRFGSGSTGWSIGWYIGLGIVIFIFVAWSVRSAIVTMRNTTGEVLYTIPNR